MSSLHLCNSTIFNFTKCTKACKSLPGHFSILSTGISKKCMYCKCISNKKSRTLSSAWGSAFQSQKTGVANWRRELHRTYFKISKGALRISLKEGGLSNLRLNSLSLLQSLHYMMGSEENYYFDRSSEEVGPFENIPWSFFSGSSSRRSLLLREEQNIKEY